jgi:hypothetical protein
MRRRPGGSASSSSPSYSGSGGAGRVRGGDDYGDGGDSAVNVALAIGLSVAFFLLLVLTAYLVKRKLFNPMQSYGENKARFDELIEQFTQVREYEALNSCERMLLLPYFYVLWSITSPIVVLMYFGYVPFLVVHFCCCCCCWKHRIPQALPRQHNQPAGGHRDEMHAMAALTSLTYEMWHVQAVHDEQQLAALRQKRLERSSSVPPVVGRADVKNLLANLNVNQRGLKESARDHDYSSRRSSHAARADSLVELSGGQHTMTMARSSRAAFFAAANDTSPGGPEESAAARARSAPPPPRAGGDDMPHSHYRYSAPRASASSYDQRAPPPPPPLSYYARTRRADGPPPHDDWHPALQLAGMPQGASSPSYVAGRESFADEARATRNRMNRMTRNNPLYYGAASSPQLVAAAPPPPPHTMHYDDEVVTPAVARARALMTVAAADTRAGDDHPYSSSAGGGGMHHDGYDGYDEEWGRGRAVRPYVSRRRM